MEIVTSQFTNFSFVSYLTFAIVLGSFFFAPNLNKNRNNSPMQSLIIANFAFWFFLGTVPGNFDIYIQIITFSSVLCICWFYWIKMNENEENKSRDFIRDGKDSVSKGYNNAKQSLKNKASEKVGGGFFGELLENTIDVGTRKADNKLSGFLSFFGNSDEYFHPSRGSINTLRNVLIITMLITMLYIS